MWSNFQNKYQTFLKKICILMKRIDKRVTLGEL